ncbi:MAG: hypothetical protein GYA59_11490, partial [Chloroflexi bacterium]|nr:hypothetical protein [Chloroflexota bacterium]
PVTVETTETQTFSVSEPLPEGDTPVQLTIGMGAGSLDLRGGAEGLVEGEVRYNVPGWEPEISRQDNELSITQKTGLSGALPSGNPVNKWELKLGNYPIDLHVNAGAYDGTLDLSAIPLVNLEISDGASNAQVKFNVPNPASMQKLEYKTGASSVKLVGLANANFSEMRFSSGAGSYTLDFSGTLQQSAKVDITSGVSEVTIIVPKGVKTTVDLGGELTDVNTRGTWTASDRLYQTDGEGPELNIQVNMGLGSLNLEQE